MAEQAQIDFTIDGAPAAKTLGELELKAEQLNEALRGAALGSAEYKKLNQQLVETNREVKNLELGFEALDNEQIASELGSVAGAVGDVTSAFILLGGESETMEQIAGNIQTAIGVSMAFKGAIEGGSSAMKLFNNVVRANPIGLLVTAVALLIAGIVALIIHFDKVKESLAKMSVWLVDTIDKLGKWKDAILNLVPVIGWALKAWEYFFGENARMLGEQMKLEQAAHNRRVVQQKAVADRHKDRLDEIKAEREAEKEAFEDRQEVFDLDIARMEAEGKNSNALKEAKIKDQLEQERAALESINAQIASWREYYEELFVLSGKSREDFIKQMKGQGIDLEQLQDEALELVEEHNRKIFSAETNLISLQRSIREENATEAIESAEEVFNVEQELNQARLDFLSRLEAAENEYLDSKLSSEDQQINKVREKYFILIEEARQFGEDTAILEQAQQEQIAEIQDKFRREREEKEKETEQEIAESREQAIEVAKQGAADLFNVANDFSKMLSEKELARAQAKVDAGEELTQKEIQRLKRQDKINKAFAVAQIAADTARGISGAIAAGAGLPFPANLGAIASGIAAVLSGALQAAQVLGESVDIPSGAGAVGEAAGEQETQSTPNIDPLGFGNTLLNQPNKVYVVESDITGTQNKVNVIENQASFG